MPRPQLGGARPGRSVARRPLGQNGESMSRSRSNKRRPGRRESRPDIAPRGGRPIDPHRQPSAARGVVCVVALLMVVSLVGFVLKPDPAVKAGPMYVTLALTTGAALLMLVMALNASFLPFISRRTDGQRAPRHVGDGHHRHRDRTADARSGRPPVRDAPRPRRHRVHLHHHTEGPIDPGPCGPVCAAAAQPRGPRRSACSGGRSGAPGPGSRALSYLRGCGSPSLSPFRPLISP